MNIFKIDKEKLTIGLFLVLLADLTLGWQIIKAERLTPAVYFLAVGQGDSELVVLPNNVKILIDGGPPSDRLVKELARILPWWDRTIDLAIISHPQTDHFGGLINLAAVYKIRAFLWTGQTSPNPALADLEQRLKGSYYETFLAPDKIFYSDSKIAAVWPPKVFANADLNESSLVLKLSSPRLSVLFTGDIGAETEKKIIAAAGPAMVQADILKAPHHGSKYSSSAGFLSAVSPKVAVIEVGNNSYGHPTPEALSRLASAGAKIYRTDRDGTVKIPIDKTPIRVYTTY